RLEYLPPYSPDFNPIEQAFSVMKARLRSDGKQAWSNAEAYHELYELCTVIKPEMTWGFFAHSGYL
ncbi:hypothetical protein K466DRAFT_455376, partial [Polyporus arcularius HHB13444]